MFAIVVSGDVRQVGTRFWQFSCLDVQQQERKNSPSFVVITELWMGHFAGILDDEDIPRPKKVKYLGLIGFDDCFEAAADGVSCVGVAQRPQNLEKLSLEELHQRKHDLKQEDSTNLDVSAGQPLPFT
jgi:hypothetical protein